MSYRLSCEKYEFIKGEVVALYEQYNIKKVPIDAFALAYKMGIKLIPYSSLTGSKLICAKKLSKDGFYIEDNYGKDFIFYDDVGASAERISMTILHEIGHCVLDHRGNSPEEEAEAMFFAKYAIAPPPLVNLIHPTAPNKIAFCFGLSGTASIYSFSYYQKWIASNGKTLKNYEIRLLALFHDYFRRA